MSEKVEIEVNGIYEGKVVRIKPFGAIVVLPNNVQGLVHISQISKGYVQNVEDYVAVGDIVRVKVIGADKATGKISLSMKEAEQPEPVQQRQVAAEYEQRKERERGRQENTTFEEKFKEWLKASNERQAGLNKRNKRR